MSATAKPISTASNIIIDAIKAHMQKTGCLQKSIAIDAGVEGNYLSMIKKGDRPALGRVVGFKQAMPDLDQHLLTSAILSEHYPDDDAQQAIIDLITFMSAPGAIEGELLEMMAEIRATDGAAGLSIPQTLPAGTRWQIRELLRQAVQTETLAAATEGT